MEHVGGADSQGSGGADPVARELPSLRQSLECSWVDANEFRGVWIGDEYSVLIDERLEFGGIFVAGGASHGYLSGNSAAAPPHESAYAWTLAHLTRLSRALVASLRPERSGRSS